MEAEELIKILQDAIKEHGKTLKVGYGDGMYGQCIVKLTWVYKNEDGSKVLIMD